jgi:hypothetical protein
MVRLSRIVLMHLAAPDRLNARTPRRAPFPACADPKASRRAPPKPERFAPHRRSGLGGRGEEHPERALRDRHLQSGHAQPLHLGLHPRRKAADLQPEQRGGFT